MMKPCVYFGLKEYFRRYCFDERNVPPLTPERREGIRRLSEQRPEWMRIELEILEESNRVTHKDLAIIINSPDPKYKLN